MKRKFCYFLFLLFLNSVIIPSVSAQKKIRVGAKAGLSIPELRSSSSNPLSTGWKSRLGAYFGAVADFKLNKKFYIQAEINYADQGGKKNGLQALPGSDFAAFFLPNPPPQYLYAIYNNESKLHYLEIPFLLRADFPLSGNWIFFADAGPYAGFLVSAKQETGGSSHVYLDAGQTQPLTPQPVPFDHTQDIKSDLKKFNLGIQGGIGLALQLKTGLLMLSGGGNYGFIKIQKDGANGANHTGAGTVTLGYLLNIR